MDFYYYERKLNDTITKAPLESGIQYLVYNVLDEMVTNQMLTQIIVDDCRKNSIFGGLGGVPDLVICTNDFSYYDSSIDKLCGCVEVKSAGERLHESKYYYQVLGSIIFYKKVICSNGLVWRFFDLGEMRKTVEETNKNTQEPVEDIQKEFEELEYLLSSRQDNLKSDKKDKKDKKEKLEKQIDEILKKDLFKNFYKPKWEIKLVDGANIADKTEVKINREKFKELIKRLNELEW